MNSGATVTTDQLPSSTAVIPGTTTETTIDSKSVTQTDRCCGIEYAKKSCDCKDGCCCFKCSFGLCGQDCCTCTCCEALGCIGNLWKWLTSCCTSENCSSIADCCDNVERCLNR